MDAPSKKPIKLMPAAERKRIISMLVATVQNAPTPAVTLQHLIQQEVMLKNQY